MRRVLITGFGAFSTHATNPTEALVRTWPDVMEVHDPWSDQSELVHVEARVLTVDEDGASETAMRLQAGEDWDAVLHLGLCGSCSNARLEWLGRDAFQMREPDNAGRRVADAPITGAGDLAAGVDRMRFGLEACDPDATWSDDAGGYVCNETLHRTLAACVSLTRAPPVLFLHIPSASHWSLDRSRALAQAVVTRLLYPPVVEVAAGALFEGERLLVARRGSNEAAAGQWELPGGKFEENESLEEAVVREWHEELGIDVVAGRYRGSWWGLRPWLRYRINVIEVSTLSPLPAVLESNAHDAITWFGPTDDVDAFSWLGPDRDVVLTLVPRP